MASISYLVKSSVDLEVKIATYTEGPDHFDEWFALVKEKYPNIRVVNCKNNNLTSLKCSNIAILNCGDNKLEHLDCPGVLYIECSNNNLTTLNAPDAIDIICENNKLESINCPNMVQLKCQYNLLTSLNCPKAEYIDCSYNERLTSIICPCITFMYCYDAPIILLDYSNPDRKNNSARINGVLINTKYPTVFKDKFVNYV